MPSTSTSRAPAAPDHVAQIVQGLRRIVRALHAFSQEVHRDFGLTGPQLWALKTLQRAGSLSTGELAVALAVHQSSASILLDRLERRGLIRRVKGVTDRRVVRIELTSRGAALSATAPEPAQGRLLYGLRAMSEREIGEIRQSVDRLVEAMEAGDTQARFFFSDD